MFNPRRMATDEMYLLGALAIGGLALFLIPGLLKKVTGAAAGAAVNAAGEVIAGTAEGVGTVLGVPLTNPDQCQTAKAAGSYWDASKYCPAGDFIGWATGFQNSPTVPAPAAGLQGNVIDGTCTRIM